MTQKKRQDVLAQRGLCVLDGLVLLTAATPELKAFQSMEKRSAERRHRVRKSQQSVAVKKWGSIYLFVLSWPELTSSLLAMGTNVFIPARARCSRSGQRAPTVDTSTEKRPSSTSFFNPRPRACRTGAMPARIL